MAGGPASAGPAYTVQQRPARGRAGRGYRLAGVIVVVVALIAGGSLAVAMSRGRAAAGPGTGAQPGGAPARPGDRAAAWVARQVGRTATVACDPAMCRLLQADGVPNGELHPLGRQTTSPLHSVVIVATPTVRAQFGSLLGAVYAPAVIASFGTGAARVDVRQIATDGAAAYRSELAADLLSRKTSGAELLSSNRVTASAVARSQLDAGQADARLLITMAGMAAVHPIYIVDFGSFAPGASAGVPLRFADVTQAGHGDQAGGHSVTAAFVRSMLTFLRAQHAPFLPAYTQTVHTATGRALFRIEFAAPSLLGLLGPH